MKLLVKAPLNLLHTFETVGHTGTLALAASELELSPDAISHAIRKLENLFDVHPFQRSTREITLTEEDEILLEHIQWEFNELQQGLALITADESRPLYFHIVPSFAHQQLLPRLGKFIRENPSIDLRLSVSTEYACFEQGGFGFDIVYGKPRPLPYERIPFAVEELTPLRSPRLAERLKKPEDLYASTLVQHDVQLYQWKGRFEADKMTPPNNYGLRFDHSSVAIAAAVDGLGVVLGSKLLVEREIASGKLVCPFVSSTNKVHYVSHYLVFPQYQHMHFTSDVFKTWLLNELDPDKIR